MPKVLMVDDDTNLCALVKDWLTSERYDIEIANTGQGGLDRLGCSEYDVVILDRSLPDMTGVDICRKYRDEGGQTPVLMLTGDKTMQSKEEGFGAGVDDFLGKPFNMRELVLRLQALMRRSGGKFQSNKFKCGVLEIDVNTKRVFKDGKEIELVHREYALLEFLMRHAGQYFTADALLTRLWPADSEASPEAIRQCVKRLRSKIDTPGATTSLIKNTHGLGYKLDQQ